MNTIRWLVGISILLACALATAIYAFGEIALVGIVIAAFMILVAPMCVASDTQQRHDREAAHSGSSLRW